VDPVQIIVMAKAPQAGRVKTRLCPPCRPDEAAVLAEAALVDTLAAALACQTDRVVLVLDGEPGRWLPPGVVVVTQRGDGLDQRLAAAWADVGGPAVQIGMDTPQVTPDLLSGACATLRRAGTDAVLGLARDGGWWAIGLHRANAAVFDGVPMSRSDTGCRQLARLHTLGLRTAALPALTDVDTFADALDVAAAAPATRFAAGVRQLAELAA
jgi:rSAM/selenodomain-associated transferase 1